MTTKMTKKDCLNAILNLLNTVSVENEADLRHFCENEIALLDKKAEKAKTKAAEKKTANDALADAVFAALDAFDGPATVNEIVAAVSGDFADVTNSKVVSRLSNFVRDGKVTKGETKVGKARLMTYSKV